MVTIYQDYADEPKDIFLPLPEDLACWFYALEMDSFTADADFYEQLLPQKGIFLELGCGTGRLTRRLAGTGTFSRFMVGIDKSLPMLQSAKRNQHCSRGFLRYCCMDMLHMAFSNHFAASLIPYNTLNLLVSKERIMQCLRGCKNSLHPEGTLLVQLFIPTEDFIRQQKTFQFQMFDRPEGGKIIKEIRKQYKPRSRSIQIEERFRVRPMQAGQANEDWNSIYTIAGFSAGQWLAMFNEAGFTATNIYGDYVGGPYHQGTSSMLIATFNLQ